MAAATLSANRDVRRQDGKLVAHKMAASKTIYSGALVATASGLAEAFTDAAGKTFAGIAAEKKVSAASGTYTVNVWKSGVFRVGWYDDDAIAQADVGTEVYGASDATVCPNASGSGATKKVAQNIKVGVVVGLESGDALVRIDGYAK